MDGELLRQMYKQHRPAIHYSVPKAWMNDPNGLIYADGYYHLFYQHHPDSTVHGPMHWGHARTKDFFTWEELPIALYPDSIGMIFSGSVVYDRDNTAGMARDGKCPLVAIFTYHQQIGEPFRQSQGIAFSYDGGVTFEKYEGNPVLDEDRVHFRDPKVFRYGEKWIMPLVAGREVRLYGSFDLKNWHYLSTFTVENPEPGGIWECPELRQIRTEDGSQRWVMLVSINANVGDKTCFGMQYWVGEFDGERFIAENPDQILMQDIGFDHYAALTFEGVEDRCLQIGWMNCWYYARLIPEQGFRGSMTFPCELTLRKTKSGYRMLQRPARELLEIFHPKSRCYEGREIFFESIPLALEVELHDGKNELRLQNEDYHLTITVDTDRKEVSMDRRGCGCEVIGEKYLEVRRGTYESDDCNSLFMILDTTSVEIFTADGELRGTMQYFIEEPFQTLVLDRENVKVKLAYMR